MYVSGAPLHHADRDGYLTRSNDLPINRDFGILENFDVTVRPAVLTIHVNDATVNDDDGLRRTFTAFGATSSSYVGFAARSRVHKWMRGETVNRSNRGLPCRRTKKR